MAKIETAKVYAFPAGGRDALKSRPADGRLAVEAKPEDIFVPVAITSWYHDEAVRDAQTSSTH